MVKPITWANYSSANIPVSSFNNPESRFKIAQIMPASIQNKIIKNKYFLGIEADREPVGILTGLKPPAWVSEGPIYAIFVRNFSSTGNLNGVTEKISYLKDLGIKTVWLLPIHPIGTQKRKGRLGSPYAIRDHLAINSDYGTVADFHKLITAVHTAGMRLIIDLVISHGAVDHVHTKTDPAMFLRDQHGCFHRKIADWSDIIDFDYSRPATRSYMLEVMSYWIREFDIDGYRCDVAGMVPLDFWETAVAQLTRIKSDLFMLAEWQRAKLHVKAFHSTYDWITYLLLKEIYQGQRPASDILRWMKEKTKLYLYNALSLLFTENHDFPRTIQTFGRNEFYPFMAIIYTMPGIPLLYNGQEWGAGKESSLFERDLIRWGKRNNTIFNFYKNLIRLRRENAALSTAEIRKLKNNHPGSVVTFLKSAGENTILVMLNFEQQKLNIKVKIPASYHIQEWQNLLNTRITKSGKELTQIELQPDEVLIWKRQTVSRIS
jgi:glycosidase